MFDSIMIQPFAVGQWTKVRIPNGSIQITRLAEDSIEVTCEDSEPMLIPFDKQNGTVFLCFITNNERFVVRMTTRECLTLTKGTE
jgi:hypothetical protein